MEKHEKDDSTDMSKFENITEEPTTLTNGSKTKNEEEEQPKKKIPKLDISAHGKIDLTLNEAFVEKEFTRTLKANWNSSQSADFKDPSSSAEIYHKPFQICLLPDLLRNKDSCKMLVNEMVEKVEWSRKQMDLYEFYQSTDLSNMSECKMLTQFLQLLRRQVRPWLEHVTNLKLDYVSASCSMYTCGDYLLVHDDLLKDRQIAFIYYLSPWEGAEWKEDHGGCLELFDSDERCFPHFPVKRKISPQNNRFAFFKVGSKSFHQVGEVTTFDYPRLTINGWFHGASNNDTISDALRPFTKLDFKLPQNCGENLEELLNEVYLKPTTRQSIQKRIEDNSEICLYEFFKRDIFQQALEQLLNDSALKWRRQGPANAQNYEVLEHNTATGAIAQLISLFSSTEMFALLRDYTDLDLAGPNAGEPSYSLELQRWSHGNYTVLGDGAICEENTLDLLYYLNAADGAGIITYLSPEAEEKPINRGGQNSDSECSEVGDEPEDDSVLLTITPIDNSLNVVYRCEGTTKFTKYVSRNTPMEKGPVFVLSCSYKE